MLLDETSLGFEVKSRAKLVDFTVLSPDDLALEYSQGWAPFKCCHMLVVYPTYEKSRVQSLQHTQFLFFFSGSRNFPSLAGNPKYCQTVLVALSSCNNSQSLVVLRHTLLSFCTSAIFNYQIFIVHVFLHTLFE